MSFSSASSASLSPLSPNAQGTADYGRSSVNGGGRDRTGISRTTTTSANNNRDDYGRSQRYHPDLDRSDYSRRPSDATSISSSSSNAADRLEALSSRLQSIRTAATATSPGMSRSNSSSSHMHSSSSRSPAMAAKRRSRSVDLDMDGPASAPVGSHHHDLLSPPGRYGAGRAMDRQGSAGSRWRSPSPPSPTASHASSYSQNPRWADRSHGSRVNPVSPGYESSETRWRSPSPTNSVASSTRDYRKKKTDDSSDFLAMLHQRRSRNNDVLVSADRLDDRSRDFRDHAPVTSPNSDDSLTTFEKSLSVYSNSSLLLGSSARGGRGRRKVLDLQEDAKSPESPRSSALRGPRDANFLDSRRNKDSGTDHLPQSPESLGSPASRDERDYGYGARSPNPSRNPRDLGYGDSRRERSTESRNWGDFRERDARDRERATYQRDDVESVYSDTTRDDLLSPYQAHPTLATDAMLGQTIVKQKLKLATDGQVVPVVVLKPTPMTVRKPMHTKFWTMEIPRSLFDLGNPNRATVIEGGMWLPLTKDCLVNWRR
ncbi:hypothetical protein BC829DRAFT_5353 [Chytridium lagenaria]|nr:hypothetical protein BC829DRAFT_5353 [Chytridium lagenaria]